MAGRVARTARRRPPGTAPAGHRPGPHRTQSRLGRGRKARRRTDGDLDPQHPRPKPVPPPKRTPGPQQIDDIIRNCGRHLLATFTRDGFIPAYAAFNLIGDPDFKARELSVALEGLNARTYKNSTLLFNLARVFIARSPSQAVINPPWTGVAEPMWSPVQIRHRSAYYDAFFVEALLSFLETGLARPDETATARRAIDEMAQFCIGISRERVEARDGRPFDVITALAPPPHPRFSRYFSEIKEKLGFGTYVPDCDTTACSFSAATQAGVDDPILDQPLLDFYAGYQVGRGQNAPLITVPLNENVDYDGAIATWIDNLAGERPYGNDLDPTLNLDVLEVSFRNLTRWQVLETPDRLETVRRIIGFQRRLVESGAFANPKSHIYYLPELYCAYVGRCYATFKTLPIERAAHARSRRHLRLHPRQGARLGPRRSHRPRNECVRCGACLACTRPPRRRQREFRGAARLHRAQRRRRRSHRAVPRL